MSTLPQSSDPLNLNPGTHASLGEKYGGENLPVLIQLPDLSALDAEAQPATERVTTGAQSNVPASELPDERVESDDRSSIRLAEIESEPEEMSAAQNDSAHDNVPERPAASPREQRLRDQRQQRRERATRRSNRAARTPVWLRGMSQLALAALLAGVLLAIVVTLKNWNAKESTDVERADGAPMVEAPTIDFAPIGTKTAVGSPSTNGPTLGPPITEHAQNVEPMHPGSPEPPAYNAPGRSEPPSYGKPTPPVGNPPAGNRTPGYTAGTTQYPTTGDGRVVRGWSETLPVSPVHSAERPAPPTDHQYYQHR